VTAEPLSQRARGAWQLELPLDQALDAIGCQRPEPPPPAPPKPERQRAPQAGCGCRERKLCPEHKARLARARANDV
jgi:hypothetical protein